jgi:hypothetical protein
MDVPRVLVMISAALISFLMRCHSVSSVTLSRMTELDTRSFTAAQVMPVIRVYDAAGNVIETHEHAGDFREP